MCIRDRFIIQKIYESAQCPVQDTAGGERVKDELNEKYCNSTIEECEKLKEELKMKQKEIEKNLFYKKIKFIPNVYIIECDVT